MNKHTKKTIRKRKKRRRNKKIKNAMFFTLIVLVILTFLNLVITKMIDENIDRQNIMLCNSAKVSGNQQWLSNCQIYYKTGDYEYLRYIGGKK